jgi:hypothetical protein
MESASRNSHIFTCLNSLIMRSFRGHMIDLVRQKKNLIMVGRPIQAEKHRNKKGGDVFASLLY